MKQLSHNARANQPVSLKRVLLRISLVLLAMYLLEGGRIVWLTVYPLVQINVSLIFLGSLIWLLRCFWRRLPFPATPLYLPILAWLLVLLVTSLTSIDPRHSLDTYFIYLVVVLLFYVLVDLHISHYSALENWLSRLRIANILTTVDTSSSSTGIYNGCILVVPNSLSPIKHPFQFNHG